MIILAKIRFFSFSFHDLNICTDREENDNISKVKSSRGLNHRRYKYMIMRIMYFFGRHFGIPITIFVSHSVVPIQADFAAKYY